MAVVVINKYAVQTFIGLIADTKPSTEANAGSIFIEANTGRRFIFDATTWQLQRGGK